MTKNSASRLSVASSRLVGVIVCLLVRLVKVSIVLKVLFHNGVMRYTWPQAGQLLQTDASVKSDQVHPAGKE